MASDVQSLQDALARLDRMIREVAPLVTQGQKKAAEARGEVSARLSGAQRASVVIAHMGRFHDLGLQQLGALQLARKEINDMIVKARNL